jgi:hypothetical protein
MCESQWENKRPLSCPCSVRGIYYSLALECPPPKAYVLRAWFSAYDYLEVEGPLEGEV